MAKNRNQIFQGSGTGESGIVKPAVERPAIATPSSEMGAPESRVKTPSSGGSENATLNLIKEHDKLTGTKAVKLKDAIDIASRLGTQLHVIHQDELKTGKMHPGLAEARTHLFGDPSFPEEDERSKGAVHYIQLAKRYHNPANAPIEKNGVKLTSTDNLSWTSLEKAGQKINAAQNSLLSVTPKAADVSVTHHVKGFPMLFTPGAELLHITKNPTPLREKGKPFKNVDVAGRRVSGEQVDAALRNISASAGIGGTDKVREDLRKAAKQKLRGTKRVRKIEKPGGKGPTPGQITPESTVFKDVEPGVAIPARESRKTKAGGKRPVLSLPTNPRQISVEPLGKGVEAGNKPKKQFRDEAPTEQKALNRVEKQGK